MYDRQVSVISVGNLSKGSCSVTEDPAAKVDIGNCGGSKRVEGGSARLEVAGDMMEEEGGPDIANTKLIGTPIPLHILYRCEVGERLGERGWRPMP